MSDPLEMVSEPFESNIVTHQIPVRLGQTIVLALALS